MRKILPIRKKSKIDKYVKHEGIGIYEGAFYGTLGMDDASFDELYVEFKKLGGSKVEDEVLKLIAISQGILVICGDRGVGKTTLLKKIRHDLIKDNKVRLFYISTCSNNKLKATKILLEELCNELCQGKCNNFKLQKLQKGSETSGQFGTSITAGHRRKKTREGTINKGDINCIDEKIATLRRKGTKIGIIFDDLDKVGDVPPEEFININRPPLEKLKCCFILAMPILAMQKIENEIDVVDNSVDIPPITIIGGATEIIAKRINNFEKDRKIDKSRSDDLFSIEAIKMIVGDGITPRNLLKTCAKAIKMTSERGEETVSESIAKEIMKSIP